MSVTVKLDGKTYRPRPAADFAVGGGPTRLDGVIEAAWYRTYKGRERLFLRVEGNPAVLSVALQDARPDTKDLVGTRMSFVGDTHALSEAEAQEPAA